MKTLAFTTLLSCAIVACGKDMVSPPLPSQAVKFTPLAAYSQWWVTTEACSGITGSYSAVEWYQTPDNTLEIDGKKVNAYWSAGENRIVLESSVIKDGQVVRHEMLHALLKQKGHPRAAFLEKCAGRVSCTTQCVADAGLAPLVPAGIALLDPHDLQVTAEAVAGPPKSAYFSIVVTVKNPLDKQAQALLKFPDPITFNCSLLGPFSVYRNVQAVENSARIFAAGETKLHIFDFFLGVTSNPGEIFAGSYKTSCGYSSNYAPDFTLTTIHLGI